MLIWGYLKQELVVDVYNSKTQVAYLNLGSINAKPTKDTKIDVAW